MRPICGLLPIVVVACADDTPRRAEPAAARERRGAEVESDLAALGYTDWVEAEDAARVDGVDGADGGDPPSGVVRFDPDRSTPGYTFVVATALARADLVDASGEVVHAWHDPEAYKWPRAELTAHGDVLVIGQPEPKEALSRDGGNDILETGRYLARLTWDGEELWRRELPVHHDVEWTPRSEIAVLTAERRTEDGFGFLDDRLVVLSADGEVRSEHSLYDLLRSNPDVYDLQHRTRAVEAVAGSGRVDLLHTNSLEWMRFPELFGRSPLYGPDHVLLSFRHQCLVAIVDLAAGRLVWAFGQGELLLQHEATLLENGNVLVFDNGNHRRRWSRVVEIDPARNEIVWEHRAPDPETFFTATKGTAQALEGGNVLVANSGAGELFEITRDGDVVWRYLAPLHRGQRPTLRAWRYPTRGIDPLLGR